MSEPLLDRLALPIGRLARLGFVDAANAVVLLSGPALRWWTVEPAGPVDEGAAAVVAALGRTADPDLALRRLAELVEAGGGDELRAALTVSGQLRSRLLNLLGASLALGEHLVHHPDDWHTLLDGPYDFPRGVHQTAQASAVRLCAAVGAHAADLVTGTAGARAVVTGPAAVSQLRAAYRRELVAVAGRDFDGTFPLEAITERLADLAGQTVQAALAVAATNLGPAAAECRLAIIAMGKTGARELNYLSDVDVIFVAEGVDTADSPEALAVAGQLAGETMRICREVAWELDAALRPEGKDGPLVRTLASHAAYYRRWASTWEFQALLKARPVAGDAELGARYVELIAPLVWTAAEREGFVPDVQAMRRRVVAHVPAAIAPREIKLGPGGLRDVEFAIQLLQLVHGRGDETLRVAGTLPALQALRDGGYVGVDDAVSLGDAYRFLRMAEHRLQLWRLRRTHLVPDDPEAVSRLARAMGFRPDARGDARAVWRSEWDLHVREVRRLHEKLFYRPLLAAVARVPSDDLRLTTAEAGRRLAALGFANPQGALGHIESLTSGLSRRAALQRALLPVMLSYFSEAPDPDAGLLAYRRVSDALGATPWFLRLLRDEGQVASRLAYLLGTSRYVARMLERAPEALQLLASDEGMLPRPGAELASATADAALRQPDAPTAVAVVRGMRRQELLRIAFADLLGAVDVVAVCLALTATTEATLGAALQIALHEKAAALGVNQLPIDFAVIAMGRLGGAEIGYGSDADVMFVFESRDGSLPDGRAAQLAQEVAERLRALLAAPSSDPPLLIDADLRPEGRDGPLVRSLGSYEKYYSRWSAPWEAQALLRARFAVGDAGLGERFTALIDPVRYPAHGLPAEDLLEIRRLKGRVDTERLPRGADPSTHLKLGRGGLADIEWTVQLLQLAHGHELAGLRTTSTLDALRAATAAGLLAAEDADLLIDAWRMATQARNAIVLVQDRAQDQLPTLGAAAVGVGRALGYPAGFDPGQLVDDYRRVARRARAVVERVFYGS